MPDDQRAHDARMLSATHGLKGARVEAKDGAAGSIVDLYFDDERWTVRYLVVDTGGLLSAKFVLLSPIAFEQADADNGPLRTFLTKEQIQQAPGIDFDLPVSRQQEVEYFRYYGWPNYWTGPFAWGAWYNPASVAAASTERARPEEPSADRRGNPHLRSATEVIGYHLHAEDGELGHVDDFLVDPETWQLRYLVVDTSNWWFGRKVLLLAGLVEQVDWARKTVDVPLRRETVRAAPEWDGGSPSRDLEERLHAYYRATPYWQDG